MISSISLSNYRKFEERSKFSIKPITVLVGPNSSGKSSVLESIMMMKDSIEKNDLKTLDPTPKDKHYGSPDAIENKSTISREIKISVSAKITGEGPKVGIRRRHIGNIIDSTDKIKIIFSFRKSKERIILEGIKIHVGEEEECISSISYGKKDKNGISTGLYGETKDREEIGKDSLNIFVNMKYLIKKSKMGKSIYTIYNSTERGIFEESENITYVSRQKNDKDRYISFSSMLGRRVSRTMKSVLKEDKKNRKKYTDIRENNKIISDAIGGIYEYVISYVRSKIEDESISNLTKLQAESKALYHRDNIPRIFDRLMKKCSQVDSVSSQKVRDFNIGQEVYVDQIAGAGYSVKVSRDGEKYPLSALGKGAARMLPLTLLFSSRGLDTITDRSIFILQEPEANLHPNLQAKIGNLLAEATKGIDRSGFLSRRQLPSILVETHSEYLVRRLQALVARGEISTEDVVVHYLNPPDVKNPKRKIRIEENGELSSPFGDGFFDQSSKLMRERIGYS